MVHVFFPPVSFKSGHPSWPTWVVRVGVRERTDLRVVGERSVFWNRLLGLEFAQQALQSFFAPVRRSREIHLCPAAQVLTQEGIQQGV